MKNYFLEIDIVQRLLRSRPYWPNTPYISIDGNNGEFGSLKIVFEDEEIEYKVYIYDKEYMMCIANNSIKNFKQIVNKIYQE